MNELRFFFFFFFWPQSQESPKPINLSAANYVALDKLLKTDPLYIFNERESEVIWKNREYLRDKVSMSKLMLSVKWTDYECVVQAHQWLRNSPSLKPIEALGLLDARFADTKVREFAVNCIRSCTDAELCQLLPQLIQALKYEHFFYAALAQFLLSRALASKKFIGHYLFWHLKVRLEYDVSFFCCDYCSKF